jgi:hypothetical protein
MTTLRKSMECPLLKIGAMAVTSASILTSVIPIESVGEK